MPVPVVPVPPVEVVVPDPVVVLLADVPVMMPAVRGVCVRVYDPSRNRVGNSLPHSTPSWARAWRTRACAWRNVLLSAIDRLISDVSSGSLNVCHQTARSTGLDALVVGPGWPSP